MAARRTLETIYGTAIPERDSASVSPYITDPASVLAFARRLRGRKIFVPLGTSLMLPSEVRQELCLSRCSRSVNALRGQAITTIRE
jgi:hypothetical protein